MSENTVLTLDSKGRDINAPVTVLKGIGEARAKAYARLGIFTVYDLLRHFPRAYENRGNVTLLEMAPNDVKVAVVLTVATAPTAARIKGRLQLTRLRAFDESGTCDIVYFNQAYLKDKFTVGQTYRFWGKVEREGRRFSMASPVAEPFDEQTSLPELYPVYRLTEGLTQNTVWKDIRSALSYCATYLPDTTPTELVIKNRLPTLSRALNTIHSPETYQEIASAKRRLVYDELLAFSLGMRLTHNASRRAAAYPCTDTDVTALMNAVGFELTEGQRRAVEEIKSDMSRGEAMRRIVVGDVGCGKTVVAAAAMYQAVKNGRQAVLMAPTEILANQHYKDLSELFLKLGVSCALLTGSTGAAEKRKIYAGLRSDDPFKRLDVVIGTHALISDGVEMAAPGIVVADEQHRFGVRQRSRLQQKNQGSHLLVMSATPIPRSLALVMYGDLDVSRITDMPPGRQRVDTFAVDEGYRDRLNAFIMKQVRDGGQVYVVCPSIDEGEEDASEVLFDDIGSSTVAETKPKLKAAVQYADELAESLDGVVVGFVHGKLKTAEKDAVMKRFVDGEVDVLVSTTVIEVGVNVPNACLMIVENAERFGLSQLHQLRGRVGRGRRKSYCVLVSECVRKNEYGRAEQSNSQKRLEIMKRTYDGYAIAEADLSIRGPGDLTSHGEGSQLRQSGGVRFRLAELCDDAGLVSAVAEDAQQLLAASPELCDYPELREMLLELFSIEGDTVS